MDKKAFRTAVSFMRRNVKIVLLMIVLMLGVSVGEYRLSSVLQAADLQWADIGLAVVRMFIQASLSVILVYLWHKQQDESLSFLATDLFKLFVPTFLVTVLLSFCVVLVVTLPLAVWLFLRLDFYMNEYITGNANGMFSCIGASFRRTKKTAGRYFVFNLKYMLFYFVIEFVLTGITRYTFPSIPDAVLTGLDIFELVFLSVFMPYRFLLKCGFYSTCLQDGKEG